MGLLISELAGLTGVSTHTVRYYEREGLIEAPPRSSSGYREFDEDVADRIRFIKGAQSVGLRLSDIAQLLEIGDRGACPCGHTRELVEQRVHDIDDEIRRLRGLKKELVRMSELECAPEPSNGWPCRVEFVKRGGGSSG